MEPRRVGGQRTFPCPLRDQICLPAGSHPTAAWRAGRSCAPRWMRRRHAAGPPPAHGARKHNRLKGGRWEGGAVDWPSAWRSTAPAPRPAGRPSPAPRAASKRAWCARDAPAPHLKTGTLLEVLQEPPARGAQRALRAAQHRGSPRRSRVRARADSAELLPTPLTGPCTGRRAPRGEDRGSNWQSTRIAARPAEGAQGRPARWSMRDRARHRLRSWRGCEEPCAFGAGGQPRPPHCGTAATRPSTRRRAAVTPAPKRRRRA